MNPQNDIKFTQLAQFQDKQLEAWYRLLDPMCKYFLYGGAAGGGKSYFLRWTAIGLGMYYYIKYGYKNVPIGLFSEDYPTLKDRQVIKMKTEIPSYLGKLVESRDLGYIFQGSKEYGEFIILLRNLDDPAKYASVEFAAIGVEELTKNKESTFDDLRFRMRYPGIDDVKFFGATNPGGIGHGFVKRKWIRPDPKQLDVEQDRFFFVQSLYRDNKYVSREYEKQLDSLPTDKRRAFKDGDWDIFAGQMFDEFRETIHTCKPIYYIRPDLIKVAGFDWGRTNPFCFLAAAIQNVKLIDGRVFRRLWVYKEVYGTNKTPAEVIKNIRALNPDIKDFLYIRCDPAIFHKTEDGSLSIADQMKAEMTQEESVKIKPANNDRIGGGARIHQWLSIAPDGYPYMIISKSCANLIRTLPELIHDELNVEDVDTDGEDHAYDTLRYLTAHIKWIDGNVGAAIAGGGKQESQENIMPVFLSTLDLDKFVTKIW